MHSHHKIIPAPYSYLGPTTVLGIWTYVSDIGLCSVAPVSLSHNVPLLILLNSANFLVQNLLANCSTCPQLLTNNIMAVLIYYTKTHTRLTWKITNIETVSVRNFVIHSLNKWMLPTLMVMTISILSVFPFSFQLFFFLWFHLPIKFYIKIHEWEGINWITLHLYI